jgi:nucleoside-diphosphate-sugar epimerase
MTSGAPRISQAKIREKREDLSTRFFLTGGTGFLGSHIAVELLRRGFAVSLLARAGNRGSAAERVREILDWFGLPAATRRRLRVVEGDITRPNLGLAPAAFREALLETDEIIHCASSTSFSERKRVEVETVNGGGLANVLDFARAGGAYFFHQISTAFVAGKADGACPEEPATAREFFNVYEETKSAGERISAAACQEAGLGLTIYRPSVVYGDSRTGRSLLFNAVYYPVRTALFIKDLYEKDIRERGGRKAAELGVRIEAGGWTRIPLRLETAGRGGINLVPVEYFTSAFLALMEGAPGGGIFHIVSPRSKRLEDLIDYSCRLFRMTGIRACSPEEFETVPKNPLEMLYDHYVEAYGPYMRDTRVFETSKSQPILERHGLACPEFDYEVFARCMTFAVEVGWGSRLFNSVTHNSRPKSLKEEK